MGARVSALVLLEVLGEHATAQPEKKLDLDLDLYHRGELRNLQSLDASGEQEQWLVSALDRWLQLASPGSYSQVDTPVAVDSLVAFVAHRMGVASTSIHVFPFSNPPVECDDPTGDSRATSEYTYPPVLCRIPLSGIVCQGPGLWLIPLRFDTNADIRSENSDGTYRFPVESPPELLRTYRELIDDRNDPNSASQFATALKEIEHSQQATLMDFLLTAVGFEENKWDFADGPHRPDSLQQFWSPVPTPGTDAGRVVLIGGWSAAAGSRTRVSLTARTGKPSGSNSGPSHSDDPRETQAGTAGSAGATSLPQRLQTATRQWERDRDRWEFRTGPCQPIRLQITHYSNSTCTVVWPAGVDHRAWAAALFQLMPEQLRKDKAAIRAQWEVRAIRQQPRRELGFWEADEPERICRLAKDSGEALRLIRVETIYGAVTWEVRSSGNQIGVIVSQPPNSDPFPWGHLAQQELLTQLYLRTAGSDALSESDFRAALKLGIHRTWSADIQDVSSVGSETISRPPLVGAPS
ncbi:MAG: hypothetical protein FJX77_00425 [Armatimonadetes bacterium]|nr:hypothetical protein [Armatimonadota bacterium]